MDQVQFDYVDKEGRTIYIKCFQSKHIITAVGMDRSKADWSTLLANTETLIIWLMKEINMDLMLTLFWKFLNRLGQLVLLWHQIIANEFLLILLEEE